MLRLDPASVDDLLKAHKLMMNGLVSENGKFRSGGVGVFDGDMLIHMAPPAETLLHKGSDQPKRLSAEPVQRGQRLHAVSGHTDALL